ncbi:Ribosomal RNA large subunit methyltransferase A [Vibrio nigripulchritudo SO65]|uniref:23S rRNA (guanine(745)-N(1))-methyltransferase n=1 Tax=Vibrio nigripulchritudo TaxID=28173 RepID=UPI0003B1EEAB|nr:23S rRNA (guanine(745)-N(1))-methyltransferase [Vibrio nigripulchritudo]CCN32999.1 Ribosomal RNA large subunit methyltransferase A [Vibrio nigripulchritudo AM115]CCN42809.1 Ribosomal RNA large subunit methyltransferase A [Vibrio nigripulchritudo FTn2]CCN63604.1 Ribosomal RNA large subunit methyltransferase A [Vibrio nigripulchritudo POn4]CCN74006.1 Ribosomal RNA large subunit methyltransferase A [Vibrio nigripulchritudo SO65]
MTYQCPLCQNDLELNQRTYRCENNHQFDVAKEGYVNLMPAHHKRSKDPGDNKEMTQARRRFLDSGHYQVLRESVAQTCNHWVKSSQGQLLDIGCGEGYYTDLVEKHLADKLSEPRVFGLDISKVAIRYAAKRYTNCQFSVASSHRLPFSDESLDAVLRIYAPCKAEELYRVINDKGVLITVTPAARHLFQLRQGIYEEVRLHDESPEILEGFTLVDEKKIHYTMPLKGSDALDLLQMTPFAWKATDEFRQTLSASECFDCEADFMIRVYQKG